jgi:hypothetical protein
MAKRGRPRKIYGAASALDLIGERFGRLVIVEEIEPRFRSYKKNPNHKTRTFKCMCDCGNMSVAAINNLRSGHTGSCGCLQREAGQRNGEISHPKHGMCGAAEYRAWCNMIQRCSNPKATRYDRYGGRGIRVCERWGNSFDAFFADVGPRPSAWHSIDRYPNNDGNYEPDNVRWATAAEQQQNQSANRMVHIGGFDLCIAEAARLLGINVATVRTRIHNGQSPEEALQLKR